jgi:hypothetical protein
MRLFCLSWIIYPYHSLAFPQIQIEAIQTEDSDIEVKFQERFSQLYPVLLSIPEDEAYITQNSFLSSINVDVTNSSQSSICLSFSNLIPEILNSSGQPLRHIKIENDIDNIGFWLDPGETFTLSPRIFLLWENNELALVIQGGFLVIPEYRINSDNDIPVIEDTFIVGNTNIPPSQPYIESSIDTLFLDNGWLFHGIQQEDYKLQFRYKSLIEPISCNSVDSYFVTTDSFRNDHEESNGFEESNSISFSSDSLPIRVLRSLHYDDKIGINNILFETILPQQSIVIPPYESGLTTSIRLGLRVTNNANIPYRFETYRNFFVRISTLQGQPLIPFYSRPLSELLFGEASGSFPIPSEQVSLLLPGESLTFFRDVHLVWNNQALRLAIQDDFTLGLDPVYFENLEEGCYEVLTWYIPSSSVVINEEIQKLTVFRDLWQHEVVVPPVQVCFVEN